MKFRQTLGQFFTSKTNWIGMATVMGAGVALYQGSITLFEFTQVVTPMLGVMGVRDTLS